MNIGSRRFSVTPLALMRGLLGLIGDRRGNIAALTALAIVPLVGAFGMAIEVGDWYLNQRAMQNAADSASVAAALNGGASPSNSSDTTCTHSGNFACEAAAVATTYGFTNGAANATVTTVFAKTGCPGGATTCYKVTITKALPLELMQVVGFAGNTTVGSQKAVLVSAVSIASGPGPATGYCLMGIDKSSKDGLKINGGGSAGSPIDLGGCDVFANTGLDCSGGNNKGNFGIGISASAGNGGNGNGGNTCGVSQSNKQSTEDLTTAPISTFAALASSIPANPCSSYPQVGSTGYSNLANNNYSGPVTLGTSTIVCGDLTLTNDTTLTTASGGTVLVIENGELNLNGHTLTASGGLTIVFSGTTSYSGDPHVPVGPGVLDYSAPSSGTWSGVALYEDPNLGASSSNITYDGGGSANNGLNFDITGLVFMPYSTFTVKGSINHATAGFACFGIIADTITVSGGGYIFPNPTSECSEAGLALPTAPGTSARTALVQ